LSFTNGYIKQNLNEWKVDIEDTSENSKYFEVKDLSNIYGIGNQYFGLRGTYYLKPYSEVYGEFLDTYDTIIPLSMVDTNYLSSKGTATLYFPITASSNFGDAQLTLIGTTTDNKTVRWQKSITIINDNIQIPPLYGSTIDLPNYIPVEVSGSEGWNDSINDWKQSSITSSIWDIKIRWKNHLMYPDNVILSQSQGSVNISSSAPTTSVIDTYMLNNISEYHVFTFMGTSTPTNYPNYYPISNDANGTWYKVATIPVSINSGANKNDYIEYVLQQAPPDRTFYFYVAMTTDNTLRNWQNNLWTNIQEIKPRTQG